MLQRHVQKREGLEVIQKVHKQHPMGSEHDSADLGGIPNQVWSYDFVHDETTDGWWLKCLPRC